MEFDRIKKLAGLVTEAEKSAVDGIAKGTLTTPKKHDAEDYAVVQDARGNVKVSDEKVKEEKDGVPANAKKEGILKLKETVDELLEAKNHMGENEYKSYNAWRSACRKANPAVTFEGDKDICNAKPGVGEWDGETGCVYKQKVSESSIADAKEKRMANRAAAEKQAEKDGRDRRTKSYSAWRSMCAGAQFDGDEEVCRAESNGRTIGDWDSDEGGIVYRFAEGVEGAGTEGIDARATAQEAQRISAAIKQQFNVAVDDRANQDGTVTITCNNGQFAQGDGDNRYAFTPQNFNKAIDTTYRKYRMQGWIFTQPVSGSFTIGVRG